MGISQWLREHGPKTGSGHELPPGVRTRGKIKASEIVQRDNSGKAIKPAKAAKQAKPFKGVTPGKLPKKK